MFTMSRTSSRSVSPLINEASEHFTHCTFCISANCEDSLCPVIECGECSAIIHPCKLEDHLTICSKVVEPCLNAQFGCSQWIRRDRHCSHLQYCAASNIACTHERGRSGLGPTSKKSLKNAGKSRTEEVWRCPSTSVGLPIDLAVARYDQDAVIEMYTYSRADRVRRRDQLNVHEPCAPPRQIYDLPEGKNEYELNKPQSSQDLNYDSSDEEEKIEAAKLKKKKAMFEHCFMCQIAPAMQHFHTLGREDARWEAYLKTQNRKRYAEEVEPFYILNKLMLNIVADITVGTSVRRAEILFCVRKKRAPNFFRCTECMPRLGVEGHCLSQHANGESKIDDFIVRCPMWIRGCDFCTTRVKPKGAEVRFITEIGAFSYRPTLDYECPPPVDDHALTLATLPAYAFSLIAPFLSGVDLRVLSMTCWSVREILFNTLTDRIVIDTVWRKQPSGSWSFHNVRRFPLTLREPTWEFTPYTAVMEAHSKVCDHRTTCPLPPWTSDGGAVLSVGSEIEILVEMVDKFLALTDELCS